MPAAVQKVSLFQKTLEERMIPLAQSLGDVSLHFLLPLFPPAVRQLVEGLQKPDPSRRNLPF